MRSSSACSSATCASITSVLVATPAANRSAMTRRASAALRTPASAAAIAASAETEIGRALADLDVDVRVELLQPLFGGALIGGRLGHFGAHAAAVEERPAQVHADVPRRLPRRPARKDLGFGRATS